MVRRHSSLGLSIANELVLSSHYVRDNAGELISQWTPTSGTHYYLFDGLGSIVGLTDGEGQLVNRYQYDPYGNAITAGTTEEIPDNPWRFAGGYFDTATGLYKFGARYYDPTVGRWTQQDPLAGSMIDPGSMNRYVYVGNNPSNFVDPDGLARCPLGRHKGGRGCRGGSLTDPFSVVWFAGGWLIARPVGAAGGCAIAALVGTPAACPVGIAIGATAASVAWFVGGQVIKKKLVRKGYDKWAWED